MKPKCPLCNGELTELNGDGKSTPNYYCEDCRDYYKIVKKKLKRQTR